jgi:8-oxo-dGTP pyrophosphatase MutT (NUDIX family)
VIGWLARARLAADREPERERVPLHLACEAGAAAIGSVEPTLAQTLHEAGLGIVPMGAGYRVDAPADRSLDRIARWLHERRLCAPWRDELLDVPDDAGAVVAHVERAVVRVLGIRTRAVHLVGSTADEREVWIQLRAFDKSTDPGRWDTLMGGQVAAGETVETTLERETMEEAGLRLDQLQRLARAASLVIRRPVPEGCMREDLDVYEATIPDGLEPSNRDGEVERFECVDRAELVARLAADAFTLEATLILGAWLERRGDAGAT